MGSSADPNNLWAKTQAAVVRLQQEYGGQFDWCVQWQQGGGGALPGVEKKGGEKKGREKKGSTAGHLLAALPFFSSPLLLYSPSSLRF